MAETLTNNEKLLQTLFSGKKGKKFFGKHVVVIGGKATILPSNDQQAARLIEKLEEQYPGQTPQLVFIPRPEIYILWIR